MKTKFTLIFMADLPYPDEAAYPGCSTREDAIALELRQFENNPDSWLNVFLARSEEVSLTGAILGELTDVDVLNAHLNEMFIELTNLDDYKPVEGKSILDIYRERARIQAEYDKTHAKLVQLRSDK